jgi:DNA-binding NarL/FixJ family response regulator
VPTRVLVIADSPIVRAGLEAVIGTAASLVSVGAVASADGADAIEAREPDVVVIEQTAGASLGTLPPLSPDAQSRAPALVVVVEHLDVRATSRLLRAGARGVLPRDASPDELVAAIDAAATGLVAIRADALGDLLGPSPHLGAEPATRPVQPLSPRELEILGLLAAGLGNKQVAARLGISEHTVKTHVTSILEKLDAYTRAEAVAIGARLGLILL